ncbi:MAG: hypothetical protein ACT4QF_21480 [Sporichthyaceae bacterium]
MSAAAGVLCVPAAAEAYVLKGGGCRFDPDNDNDGLGISFKTSGSAYNATERLRTEYAASDWNNKMTPSFTIVSYASTKQDLYVDWVSLGARTYADMTTWCDSGDNHYSQDPRFRWNTTATSYPKTQARQVGVAVHELGHAYGLAHNDTGGCNQTVGNAGLMHSDPVGKYDLCGWANPTDDDAAGATDAHY